MWMRRQRTRDEVTVCLYLLQIWSMESDEPIHSCKVRPSCCCLAWRPNWETDDGGIAAARESKNNFTIAW